MRPWRQIFQYSPPVVPKAFRAGRAALRQGCSIRDRARRGRTSWWLELVDARGIAMEEPGLLVFAGPLNDRARGFDPAGERAGTRHHRMIAAPHDAIPAEALYDMLDIGADGVDGPVGARIGDNAGNLGVEIGQSADPADVFAPGIEPCTGDIGHAAMVEDETDIGRPLHQHLPDRQLVRPYAEVEGQVVVGQVADVLDEQVRLAEFVRQFVQDPAHTLDMGMAAQLLDLRSEERRVG